MVKETDEEGRNEQRRSKELIENAILEIVAGNPDDFTADDVRALLGQEALNDPGFRSEMMGGAFSALAQRGLIKSFGSRTSQAPGMKNRRVTVYAATPKLRTQLGLEPSPSTPILEQSPQPSGTAAVDFVSVVFRYAQQIGFICEPSDLANLILCMQAKPFVILSGISGTGKSLLPRLIADVISADFVSIPVKPNWNDNSYLMGYYSLIQDDFVSGPVTRAVEAAADRPAVPMIIRLDEMNLAHVEHYFSDLLSIMENRRRTETGVTSDILPLDLPEQMAAPSGAKLARIERLRSATLPWNVFIVGTVNVDETTHPFSRKVLDRSFAIEFSAVDLTAFSTSQPGNRITAPDGSRFRPLLLDRPLNVNEVYGQAPEFFQDIAGRLQEFNSVLMSVDLQFGYRVRDEICLYMDAWRRHNLSEIMSIDEAFDYCLLQKVLPRCHGTSDASRRALEQLFFISAGSSSDDYLDIDLVDDLYPITTRRYRRSSEKCTRMLRQYRDSGFFSFWNS